MHRTTSEMIQGLPFALRQQISSHLDYVNDRLVDLLLERNRYDLRGRIAPEVEILFALRYVYLRLNNNYGRYIHTLDFFERSGIQGFVIGGTSYSRNTDITREWRQINNEMRGLLDDPELRNLVTTQQSVEDILEFIVEPYLDSGE